MSEIWWETRLSEGLAQGDLLPRCVCPIFEGIQFVKDRDGSQIAEIEADSTEATLIVVSQSCDLENQRIDFVALCKVDVVRDYVISRPDSKYKQKSFWDDIRKGKSYSYHLLQSPENPNNSWDSLLVDFGQIVSLPIGYLQQHAAQLGNRKRLLSPYLEHFSQAFARFFMRVGLPSNLPPFERWPE